MVNALVSTTVCSACGEPLGTKDACFPCLLRAGLDDAGGLADSNGDIIFGDFEIERREDGSLWELGRGAMGVTFRATDKVLHRTVALKVIELPATASDSPTVRERFLREARAAAALRHSNIAGVFHFGASSEGDRCYCAMELVEGETLEARVRREGPLKLDLALEVAVQVTRALMAAAERRLVHRDLKPGNIMLAHDGDPTQLEVKVIDFGLAKAASEVTGEMELTHGGFVGTPAFASPEQFAGDAVDARSDIYALGVTLWFALTGRLPFAGRTIEEIRDQQAHSALPLEQLKARAVPEAVIDLLRSCLAIDPAKRPASAGELMQAIASYRDRSRSRASRRKLAPIILGMAVLAVAVFGFFLTRPKEVTNARPASDRPIEKGIAVLPFENLSAEKDDAFFADGIQDDVLTSVGKIKGLKVIARGSVMDYRGARLAGKIREIGQTLAISHVLEGSVRRVGDRVVINVALIDTRDERRVWSERYERTLTDTLSLQGELAVEIARALHATLTPLEQRAVATKPTENPDAYVLYLRARELELRFKPQQPENYEAAVKLYQQAVDLDPKFALARARLSLRVTFLAFHYPGKTSARMQKALDEAEEALRLQPHLGEARVALAHYYTWAKSDFDRALAELSRAEELIPNSAEVWNTRGQIYKRQDKFRERIAALQHAETLDPRGTYNLGLLWATFRAVRNWPEVARTGDRMKALLRPEDNRCFWGSAYCEFRMSGATDSLKKAIAEAPIGTPPGILGLARYELAVLERDFPAAERFLRETPAEAFEEWTQPKLMQEALLAVAHSADPAVIERALVLARQEIETLLADEPAGHFHDGRFHTTLGLIDAFRGRKEEAIRAGRRGLELADYSILEKNDAAAALALIYARTGEPDEAIKLIEKLLTLPANLSHDIFSITLTDLKWRWVWDPLRSHPRFQKLLAGPEPKTLY